MNLKTNKLLKASKVIFQLSIGLSSMIYASAFATPSLPDCRDIDSIQPGQACYVGTAIWCSGEISDCVRSYNGNPVTYLGVCGLGKVGSVVDVAVQCGDGCSHNDYKVICQSPVKVSNDTDAMLPLDPIMTLAKGMNLDSYVSYASGNQGLGVWAIYYTTPSNNTVSSSAEFFKTLLEVFSSLVDIPEKVDPELKVAGSIADLIGTKISGSLLNEALDEISDEIKAEFTELEGIVELTALQAYIADNVKVIATGQDYITGLSDANNRIEDIVGILSGNSQSTLGVNVTFNAINGFGLDGTSPAIDKWQPSIAIKPSVEVLMFPYFVKGANLYLIQNKTLISAQAAYSSCQKMNTGECDLPKSISQSYQDKTANVTYINDFLSFGYRIHNYLLVRNDQLNQFINDRFLNGGLSLSKGVQSNGGAPTSDSSPATTVYFYSDSYINADFPGASTKLLNPNCGEFSWGDTFAPNVYNASSYPGNVPIAVSRVGVNLCSDFLNQDLGAYVAALINLYQDDWKLGSLTTSQQMADTYKDVMLGYCQLIDNAHTACGCLNDPSAQECKSLISF